MKSALVAGPSAGSGGRWSFVCSTANTLAPKSASVSSASGGDSRLRLRTNARSTTWSERNAGARPSRSTDRVNALGSDASPYGILSGEQRRGHTSSLAVLLDRRSIPRVDLRLAAPRRTRPQPPAHRRDARRPPWPAGVRSSTPCCTHARRAGSCTTRHRRPGRARSLPARRRRRSRSTCSAARPSCGRRR